MTRSAPMGPTPTSYDLEPIETAAELSVLVEAARAEGLRAWVFAPRAGGPASHVPAQRCKACTEPRPA